MKHRLALAALLVALVPAGVLAQVDDPAPTPEQQRVLLDRIIASQHRDDAAVKFYERIERRQVRRSATDASPTEDETYRVVPTGTGTLRLQIGENGRAADGEFYRKQLRTLEQALLNSLNPNTPGYKQDAKKFAKRQRERAEFVDATRNAFLYTWLGREARNGRALAKFRLEPNPEFKPTSRNTSLLAHARGTVWVDEAAGQVVRVEAELFRDISLGGGVLGKIYHGSRIVFEHAEVAPGIWLPTRYEYDFTGRKFLFGFEVHETTEASHYRRIGPPAEALATIRRELSQSGTPSSSP